LILIRRSLQARLAARAAEGREFSNHFLNINNTKEFPAENRISSHDGGTSPELGPKRIRKIICEEFRNEFGERGI